MHNCPCGWVMASFCVPSMVLEYHPHELTLVLSILKYLLKCFMGDVTNKQ